jgi:hypothetical protein
MALVDRFGDERIGTVDHLRRACGAHRHGPQGVVDALLGEFVLRIEVDRRAKLRQRLHLPASQ